jgi:hypothetical protein
MQNFAKMQSYRLSEIASYIIILLWEGVKSNLIFISSNPFYLARKIHCRLSLIYVYVNIQMTAFVV